MLEGHTSDNGVWQAIKSLGEDKAPGLDGFPFMFFKKCYMTLKRWVFLIRGSVVKIVMNRDFSQIVKVTT